MLERNWIMPILVQKAIQYGFECSWSEAHNIGIRSDFLCHTLTSISSELCVRLLHMPSWHRIKPRLFSIHAFCNIYKPSYVPFSMVLWLLARTEHPHWERWRWWGWFCPRWVPSRKQDTMVEAQSWRSCDRRENIHRRVALELAYPPLP